MRAVDFPDWSSVMNEDPALSEQQRAGFEITIRWFLGYCKREHQGATIELGHAFMAEVVAGKLPNEWVPRKRLRLTRFLN